MTHALETIIAPLALERVADAETRIDALGNPAHLDIQNALDRLELLNEVRRARSLRTGSGGFPRAASTTSR